MAARLLGGILAVAAFACLVLASCVGDDPSTTTIVDGNDGSADGIAPPPPDAGNGRDGGGADAEAGPPGGVTLAQIGFVGDALDARVFGAPGGGVLLVVRKNGGPPADIGGVTIPCATCTYLVKLDPDLKAQWYWTYEAGNQLATSPDGHVYWMLESEGGGGRTATLTSSKGTSQQFVIPGGAGNQGDVAGGAVIVLALNPDGSIRWSHKLAETDITEPRTIAARSLAASDKTVFVSGLAAGTLNYTDILGASTNKVIGAVNANFTHELDTTNGRTKDLVTMTAASPYTEHFSVVGSAASGGQGFFAYVYDRADELSSPTNHRVVSLDSSGGGATPQILNALPSTSGGFVYMARMGVFPIGAMVTNVAPQFGSDTFTPPAGRGTEAFYFLFDNATPKAKAVLEIGGSGGEQATGIADATGGDIYCAGVYKSSDLKIAGKTLPATSSGGSFVVRAHVDVGASTITPVWAASFAGTARVDTFLYGLATDAVSGDAYVVGFLSAGKADFGLGDIQSPGTGLDTRLWMIKVRR